MASGNKNVMEQTVNAPVKASKMKVQVEAAKAKTVKPVTPKPKVEQRPVTEEGPWICSKCDEAGEPTQEFVLYYLYRKHMTDAHNETFDTRLCKYCGQWCGKHNLMMYHLYTKHGLKPPTTYNFPKCDQCPYIALSAQKLTQHKMRHDPSEMQCIDCHLAFSSQQTLTSHIQITGHLNRNGNSSYDCQYCTKRLQSAINLFSHIKNSHLKEAKRDGIVILDEIDEAENDTEEGESVVQKDKVKIISNVKVPVRSEQSNSNIQATAPMESSSEAEALSNVASGIATSLGLVDIVVLNDNQQYILQQQEDPSGQPEFIIPDLTTSENHFAGQVITTQHSTVLPQGMLQSTGGDITSTDELVMVLTDHDYQDEQEGATTDNSNIVVLYSHPVDGQQGQFITSQGNLLVNSQTGMLEIRNEAIAGTAANHMMVNSSVDTSESIESIQREIQSHREMKQEPFYEEEPKATMVQAPQPNQVPPVPEQQPEEQPLQNEEVEPAAVGNVDQGTTTENLPLENYQEGEACNEPEPSCEGLAKPGEGDGNQGIVEGPDETSGLEEENPETEQTPDNVDGGMAVVEEPMETEEVPQPISEDSPIEKELSNQDSTQEKPEEIAVPSSEEINSTENAEGVDVPPPEKVDFEEDNALCENSENYVFNDPSKIGDVEPSENPEEDVPEQMEVDGKISSSQLGDAAQPATTEEHVTVEEKETEEIEEAAQIPEEIEEAAQIPEENRESEGAENQDGTSTDQQEEGFEMEEHHQSETDNSQYNEEEDDNSQSSRDTGQSQDTSADNRNQGNINQAILEDWEDTDSQQSEKQRAAMKQAAEKVNKLMDDWEEEEEDDKKEGE